MITRRSRVSMVEVRSPEQLARVREAEARVRAWPLEIDRDLARE